ncbi:MAG: GYF domain-containing protein [Pirellulales bacterium]
MGIRFQCPNGHKINVKAFLAGKRALCPKCGAKVVVPLESQTAAPSTSATASTSAASNGSGTATAQKHAASPAVSAQPASPRASTASAAPVSAHAAGPIASPSFGADLSAAAAAVSAPRVGVPGAIPPAVAADPIAEAPQAVWYVRPRTGGQYGPAPGDIFRQWITQRRVTADSLVWRDGWTDWRLASEVLPQLATKAPPGIAGLPSAATPAALASATAGAESINSTAARYVKGRRSKSSTVVTICALALVAIALVGVLIWVLLNRP